jgi:hypothetical protein
MRPDRHLAYVCLSASKDYNKIFLDAGAGMGINQRPKLGNADFNVLSFVPTTEPYRVLPAIAICA